MSKKKKWYAVDIEYKFTGTIKVKATDGIEAAELAEKHVGLVIGGDVHSTLPSGDVDWDFNVHPSKVVTGVSEE